MTYTKKAVRIQSDGSGLIECQCGEKLKVTYASGDYVPCTCGYVYDSMGWVRHTPNPYGYINGK